MVRPTIYTAELGREILDRFSGGETILQICESEEMPHRASVYRWIASDKSEFAEFQAEYQLAAKAHALALADEVLEISDDTGNDTITKTSKSGESYDAVNNEWIARARLRVDTRFKLMAKRAPALFGEAMQLSGPGGAPIQITDPNGRDVARRIALALALGLANANAQDAAASAPMLEHEDAA